MPSASRKRRSTRKPPGSRTAGVAIENTLPGGFRDPRPPEGREAPGRFRCGALGVEEAVERRPGAADVSAEGARGDELRRERRRGEVVGWKSRQLSRRRCGPGDVQNESAPLLEAGAAAEAAVDRGRRGLLLTVREQQEDCEVLRQPKRFERRAVAGAELRAL